MCFFCGNDKFEDQIGWLRKGDDCRGFCVDCSADEDSKLYEWWEKHPEYRVCIP